MPPKRDETASDTDPYTDSDSSSYTDSDTDSSSASTPAPRATIRGGAEVLDSALSSVVEARDALRVVVKLRSM